MRRAVIDLGTNSVLLLVAEMEGGEIATLAEEERIGRIGQGISKGGWIASEAMERNLAILDEYREIIAQHEVHEIVLVGTSPLRLADNAQEFIGLVFQRFGWSLRVLSAEEEAELSFRGALVGLKGLGSQVMMLDIGGGSTELVFGKDGDMEVVITLALGAVHLTELHIRNDPPLEEEKSAVGEAVRLAFHWINLPPDSPRALVGAGGTVTTLAAIAQEMEQYDPELIHGYFLQRCVVEEILRRLMVLPLVKRRQIIGLTPGRADIIVAGTAMLLEAMRILGVDSMMVSHGGIRWGAMVHKSSWEA